MVTQTLIDEYDETFFCECCNKEETYTVEKWITNMGVVVVPSGEQPMCCGKAMRFD